MKALFLALLIFISPLVRAESFFQAEAGLGMSLTNTLGDGVWYQQGSPHALHMYSPAFLLGVTGELYSSGPFSVRYHVDYNFLGTQSASCVCVPDSQYNPKTHTRSGQPYIPFNGGGFVHGISATIEPGYSIGGYRLSVEGGPFLFWAVWHESRLDPQFPDQTDLSHRASVQLGWVAGLGISRGNFSLKYRYYIEPQKWNPYPAIQHGTHMLFVTYTF